MRIVVWTVVGLLVVAAVIMFVVVKPGGIKTRGAPTAADFKRDAAHYAKTAKMFEDAAAKLGSNLTGRGRLSDDLKAKLADLQAKAAQIRDKAKQLEAATGQAADDVKKELVALSKECDDLKATLQKAGR